MAKIDKDTMRESVMTVSPVKSLDAITILCIYWIFCAIRFE